MKSKIVLHENRVKIYFKEGQHFIRYNTGIPVFSISEFYRNNPENLFNLISPKYIDYNDQIKHVQETIEEIIDENLGKIGITLNNEYIRRRINVTHNQQTFKKKYLLEYYQDFLTTKLQYYKDNKASKFSGKDYISLREALIDYHICTNRLFELENLNYDWVNSFLSFLTEKHTYCINESDINEKILLIIKGILDKEPLRKYKQRFFDNKIRVLSKGELCDNTTQKRFDNLNEFIKYLYKNKIITWYPEEIKDLRKLYKTYYPSFTTLTIDEVEKVFNFQIDFDYPDKRYEFVKDIFVFMSLTSFRFSDVASFSKEKNIIGNKIYKYPQKTEKYDTISIIDLIPPVRGILEKYDYKLNLYDNTLFNRYLTEFLGKTDLFNERFIRKKRIKGRQVQLPDIKRFEAISTHSGRRTCITNLISKKHELARIRTITGHTSDRMLYRYYDAFRRDNDDNSDLMKSLDFTSKNDSPSGIKNN